jgi:hypothetical protein
MLLRTITWRNRLLAFGRSDYVSFILHHSVTHAEVDSKKSRFSMQRHNAGDLFAVRRRTVRKWHASRSVATGILVIACCVSIGSVAYFRRARRRSRDCGNKYKRVLGVADQRSGPSPHFLSQPTSSSEPGAPVLHNSSLSFQPTLLQTKLFILNLHNGHHVYCPCLHHRQW